MVPSFLETNNKDRKMILGGEKPQQFERLDANHVASLRRYIAHLKESNSRNDAAHTPITPVEEPLAQSMTRPTLVPQPAALEEHHLVYEVQDEPPATRKSA
jgi:hypothetical protein